MKTCPYCGSKIKTYNEHFYCEFCDMKQELDDIQENGKRKNLLPESQPSFFDLNKSTPELMRFSTFELLFLLKFARKKRTDIYKHRHLFIQAIKEGANELAGGEQYTYQQYEKVTRKCFVLENLIRERIGYYPAKITDPYLQNLAVKMKESAKKDMVIQQAEPIN
jgi:hypothetical protein